MKPARLYLKGFAGIRAGLNREELEIDLDRLAGDAPLVALAGPNGSGKTTVMDNLHPYRLMPSRASSLGVGGFSFYEHLVAPEAIKELSWEHGGNTYRSTLVLRQNGARRSEAYLHEQSSFGWVPVRLADGTVSDGKMQSYDRCVEAILGNPETFFTSVFSAQNRRPLASYANAEIKALMVNLLGLERIREVGGRAGEVIKLLRQRFDEARRALASVNQAENELIGLQARLAASALELQTIGEEREAAKKATVRMQERLAALKSEQAAASENDQRRRALSEQLRAAEQAAEKTLAGARADLLREESRKRRAEASLQELLRDTEKRRAALSSQIGQAQQLLTRKEGIQAAVARIPALTETGSAATAALSAARERLTKCQERTNRLAVLKAKLDGLQKEAGAAALKAEGLKKRCGLSAEVPCHGTDLQPRCKLLADANEARTLVPSADAEIENIKRRFGDTRARIRALEQEIASFGDAAAVVAKTEEKLQRVVAERRTAEKTAALATSLAEAEQRRHSLRQELTTVETGYAENSKRIEAEMREIDAAIAELSIRAREQEIDGKRMAARLQEQIDSLPQAFDSKRIEQAEVAIKAAESREASAERKYLSAVTTRAEVRASVATREKEMEKGQGLRARIEKLEKELGWWNLLAKALSNDGMIALCIDDAGPTLSSLANDLLLSCYGPRFSVSIRTQLETARKDLKEGFDIAVFDSEARQSKSVSVMSGGEKVSIDQCLTRAIALYLARSSGCRYQTLFSDEADGALDSERKRMFMRMKREVLRLGGYEREYFVSQTPELCSLADAVIDLGRCGSCELKFKGATRQDARESHTCA